MLGTALRGALALKPHDCGVYAQAGEKVEDQVVFAIAVNPCFDMSMPSMCSQRLWRPKRWKGMTVVFGGWQLWNGKTQFLLPGFCTFVGFIWPSGG